MSASPRAPTPRPTPRPTSASGSGRDQSWRPDPRHRPGVNAYARDRYQQRQAGTWAPFTSTIPVREHLDQLREAGMTGEQIARASGVSVSTLGRAYKVTRMTATAADAILAVESPTEEPGLTPGLGPARQLQALVADGWHLEQLAHAAGINDRTAWRTVHGYSTPSARTTTAVEELYENLKWEDPGDGPAAVRSRRRAQRHGWTTLYAAGAVDIADSPPAAADDLANVDEVAVDRVVFGDPSSGPPTLRPQEQQAALRRMAGNLADDQIAQRLGIATRTVVRHRLSQGLPAYAPVHPVVGRFS